MAVPEIEEIYVLTSSPGHVTADGRPVRLRGGDNTPGIASIPVDKFKSGMTTFMGTVQSLVGEIADQAGNFEVDQIEIAGSVGADGRVALLGSGVSVESTASFKVTLTRPGK